MPEIPEPTIKQRLMDMGRLLDFDVKAEVEASESAWVDVVWFDKRLPIPEKPFKMRYEPVLPVVGFEIELHTGLNAKHVKGSVSNLSNLGAQLGVIVIGQANLEALNFSHCDATWSYSSFDTFRQRLASEAGIRLNSMQGYGGSKSWDGIFDPIVILLNHVDCQGTIPYRSCEALACRLKQLTTGWSNDDFDEANCSELIRGLEQAARAREDFEFL